MFVVPLRHCHADFFHRSETQQFLEGVALTSFSSNTFPFLVMPQFRDRWHRRKTCTRNQWPVTTLYLCHRSGNWDTLEKERTVLLKLAIHSCRCTTLMPSVVLYTDRLQCSGSVQEEPQKLHTSNLTSPFSPQIHFLRGCSMNRTGLR